MANMTLKENPNSLDALYYATISKAFIASIERDLSLSRKIIRMVKRLIQSKSKYTPTAYRLLGRMYFKLPSWPISFSDNEKAMINLALALEVGKVRPFKYHRYSYLYLSELLIKEGHRDEALILLKQGLELPIKKENITEESDAISTIKTHTTKLSKK
jgi:tetratricopeptide (TPR) repeat protein